MTVTRRTFGKRIGVGFWWLTTAAGLTFTLTGCNVFNDIETWVPTAVLAINGIATVLGTFLPPGAALILTSIKAFLADLAAAVKEYQSDTNPADKNTVLARIRTFLSNIADNFQNFLMVLNLGSNPIVKIVLGLVTVILSAISGFMGQLPVPTGGAPLTVSLTVAGNKILIVPKVYKRIGDFKADYNAVCAANGHPEIELH
jgi:hypothetical protein